MYFGGGFAVLADEDQSGAAICYIQNHRLATPRLDWLHSDDEKFADRLVKILDAQLRTDFGCREFEAELSSTRVNIGQGHSIGRESKLGWRYEDKLHVCRARAKHECRSSKYFSGLPTDTAAHAVQFIAQSKRISEGTNGDGLPCRHIAAGLNELLGHFGGARLELQLVLQDIASRALSPRWIGCELNDAGRAQYRHNEVTAAPARARMTVDSAAMRPSRCDGYRKPLPHLQSREKKETTVYCCALDTHFAPCERGAAFSASRYSVTAGSGQRLSGCQRSAGLRENRTKRHDKGRNRALPLP
ncbi:hypothetical protein ABIA94_001659 [Bradyrhizobium sp. LA7.1]